MLAATSLALIGLTPLAHAEGLTLKLEGGLSLNNLPDVGIVRTVRDPVATDTTQLTFDHGLRRSGVSLNYRGEATWDLTMGSGTLLRLGAVVNGVERSSDVNAPVYAFVMAQPNGPDPNNPLGYISICTFPDPCAGYQGALDRSYSEIMPLISFGRRTASGATNWFGLQGFSGQLDESTSNRAYLYDSLVDLTTETDLAADTTGFLLTFQHERPLASGATLFAGARLGTYKMDVTGASRIPDNLASERPVSGSIDGTRAQLSVGVEYPVRKGMTLGATVRADYWSDQPQIGMDWTDMTCSPTLCEPPAAIDRFNLVTDPMTSISVGVSLTIRM